VGPAVSSPGDVAALLAWRRAAREGGGESPPWTLCASGGGRLLLLYDTHAAPADVIDGFAVAWLAAAASAPSLRGGREAPNAAQSAGLGWCGTSDSHGHAAGCLE